MTPQSNGAIDLYKKHYIDKDDERLGLFLRLSEKYSIKRVLYPGCFIHITPSLVFPDVVYVDNYKNCAAFFKDQTVFSYIENNKRYDLDTTVVYHKSNYSENFGEAESSFDLLISQSAGFVSKACKMYLKIGGILLVNSSHGDAAMASIDDDYRFIAVYNKRKSDFTISAKNLDAYFIPKSGIRVTRALLESTRKGIGYTKTASGYIFEKR